MAAKLSLVFLVAFVVFQVVTWESEATVVRREAPEAAEAAKKNASQTIDEAIESLKTGLLDLSKKIQGNELYQNVSQALQSFGESIQQQGKQLVDKIQADSSKAKN